MRIVLFYHSLVSDWNHGNAHFLRGIADELLARGAELSILEPVRGWSARNLAEQEGPQAIAGFHRAYPNLRSSTYSLETLDLDEALAGADVVIVHEWSAPELVQRIGDWRRTSPRTVLLFHDTHHRSVSAPAEMDAYDLSGYDGALVFGESIREQYLEQGWADRVWTWHEAADTRVFRPLRGAAEGDLVWIGNWGDGERSAELQEFLIDPVHQLGLRAKIHGVRYPEHALSALRAAGIEYGGWLPNYRAPEVFAGYGMTVHVPRRFYSQLLPGIPTIRVFEALACGMPLVSAPWDDIEGLFQPGRDYLVARNGAEMREHLRTLREDESARRELSRHGLQTIRERHTCAHRVDEFAQILEEEFGVSMPAPAASAVHE